MQSASLPPEPQATAPDGSAIRFLLKGSRGELNHFTLPPHQTSTAVVHRSIEEIWYVLEGKGQVWRQEGDNEEVLDLRRASASISPPAPDSSSATPAPSPCPSS